MPRPPIKPLQVLAACLSILLALCRPSAAAPGAAPRVATLEQNPVRPRWLSLPQSRLVINPRYASPPPTLSLAGPELALNLSYYSGETPIALPAFWAWEPLASPQVLAQSTRVIRGPKLDFAPVSASAPDSASASWKASGVTARFEGEQASLALEAGYGSITRQVSVNLDQTPTLLLRVPGGDAGWALKVNAGSEPVDTVLVADTGQRGLFAIDVRAATGWSGAKSFKVVLFAVGGKGKTLLVEPPQFVGIPQSSRLAADKASWLPHQITSRANSADQALELHSTTALLDESTVAQRLVVRKSSGSSLLLSGQLAQGRARWDASRSVLILEGERFVCALALSRPARWLGVRASGADWLLHPEAPASSTSAGVWALALDDLRAGEQIVVAARFAPTVAGGAGAEVVAQASRAARRLASTWAFQSALREQEAAWDRRLALVPRPLDFEPRAVDALGVRAEDVRRAYYTGWVFLFANILPPMPENGFRFPQAACGKPSGWSEGAPHARASAQWESFLAMQSLALADPHLGWACFEGLMSLVGSDGSFNGEGLPSCHARTAWVLATATGDMARLRRLYPAIKRLLGWKIANPRWILKDSTPPDMRDNEFVVHALIDIEFAARIARALRLTGEEALWARERTALAARFHEWFWEGQSGPSYRLFRAQSGEKSGPDEPWNLQALALAPDILQPWARAEMLRSLRARWNPSHPFLLDNLSRFPNYELVRRGLWQNGERARADAMADAAMRDITRADEFAEVYGQNTSPPTPEGVWPSVFGARHIIDAVLWHNGVVADEGLPILLPRTGALGLGKALGVDNLRGRGKPMRVRFEAPQSALSGLGLVDVQGAV